jgi:SAM-dependent methyltransferase
MVSKNIELVKGVLSSLVDGSEKLVVMDFGCGRGVFAEYLRESGHEYVGVDIDKYSLKDLQNRGLKAYHPDNLPKDLKVDILLLGNMNGIETGMHLVNVRKLLKNNGTVFMWDFSKQRLPKGEFQQTVVMSVVSKDG